ncbi:MAG: hypothetical protein OES24_01035 [Acidimicrobiia bacterium]|nr:hypothetical protein [Acidimicrobiia bacterium]
MTVLADALPAIALLAAIGMTILLVRLNRRVSRGSRSAGPRTVEPPNPAGLTATPWELEAIDLQLRSPKDSAARRDLVATVNRLITASRDRTDLAPMPLDASNDDIERVVAILESRLDLRHE